MNIQTVRRAAQHLRIALNTDAWRNRLDSLGIKITVTDGPGETYDYGIQIVYRAAGLTVHMYVVTYRDDNGDAYGILSATTAGFSGCDNRAVSWLRLFDAMDVDFRGEIKAAFGFDPSYDC